MKFSCPNCGQHIAVETLYQGEAVECPNCAHPLTVPEKPTEEFVPTLQSSIDRAERTISQFMAEQELDGGVDLSDTQSGTTASQYITSDQGQKYKLGRVVATGGMGAILDAKEHNLRRQVAMKVVLNAEEATKDHILRFIEEAQVTAQLEHPSVVPVHELGVDSGGNVFYTMKMVQGETLKEILKKIDQGDREAIEAYPLSRLLNIFQRVCDAIAFAHHKHVIHRDLKPENIMVGEYGEVQVMDWGLAKVLGRPDRESDGETVHLTVDSVRKDEASDTMKTMDGAIMGTPGYMAPEQAQGSIEGIDQRSDIYALGAILYNIITLNKPISFATLEEFFSKIGSGDIPHPTQFNPTKVTRKSRAAATEIDPAAQTRGSEGPVHCPGRRVPESLAAVAMKALETDPEKRYQHVKDLQADIEAYQNGFATSAEDVTAWKQVQLFVKRNKAASIAAAAVLVTVLAGGGIALAQGVKAQRALAKFRKEQAMREAERKLSAPSVYRTCRYLLAQKEFDQAREFLATAIDYDPGQADPWALLALLQVRDGEYGPAARTCEKGLTHLPGNKNLEKLLAAAKHAGQYGKEHLPVQPLLSVASSMGLDVLSAEFASDTETKLLLYKKKIAEAWPGYERNLKYNEKDEIVFSGSNLKVSDLSPVMGMPIVHLNLQGSKKVRDLSPLKGMPLKSLNLNGTAVAELSPLKGMPLTTLGLGKVYGHAQNPCRNISDLSPLQGMQLEELTLFKCEKLRDLSPLKGMPLKSLNMQACEKVVDLSPLQGMPLEELSLKWCSGIKDLSPLKGMPLKDLGLDLCTGISDLSPLKGMPLEKLALGACKGVSDISPLKGMPLKTINLGKSSVVDLSPLEGMALEYVNLTTPLPSPQSALSAFRGMKTLTYLNAPTRNILKGAEEALITKDLATARAALTDVVAGFGEVPVFASSVAYAKDMLAFLAGKHAGRPGVRELGGHHYWYSGEYTMRWADAKLVCEAVGGHLITLNTEQERELAIAMCGNSGPGPHVGALLGEKGPKWVTGEEWNSSISFNRREGHLGGSNGQLRVTPWSIFKRGDISGEGSQILPYLIEWDK